MIREILHFGTDKFSKEVRTDYHVLLSPTWQVPVLFFSTMWVESLEPLTIQDVYTYIVEKPSKGVLEDVGVLGGISHGVPSKISIPQLTIRIIRS